MRWSLITAIAFFAVQGFGQQPPAGGVQRPGDSVQPLPQLLDTPQPTIKLPPPPEVSPGEPTGLRVFVREIRVEGQTVLSQAEIAQVIAPFVNRELDSSAFETLRERLTLLYVDHGYLSSGFRLPDQEIRNGIVIYRAVEGRLTEVEITGDGMRLRPDYVQTRILRGANGVLSLASVRDALTVLQQSGLIERLQAELQPTERPGEARLRVQIDEAIPYQAGISFGNTRSPSVGENRFELFGLHRNLTGRGDLLEAHLGTTRGLDDFSLNYNLPLNAQDTTLTLKYFKTDSLVIETPFDILQLRGKSTTTGIAISQPLRKTPTEQWLLSLGYEQRRSQTFLLGIPFSFTPGVPDGLSTLGVWRLGGEAQVRSAAQAISARLTLSAGDTNSIAPKPAPNSPDQSFLVWLGQLQWVRRVSTDGDQVIARFDIQRTNSTLLPLERFGLGGANTVRGFRENQLLGDEGELLSLEYRMPLGKADWMSGLQLAPFFDHGRSRSNDAGATPTTGITSVGLGVLYNPNRHVQAQVYFAHASRRFDTAEKSLQDRGIHFSVSYQYF